MNWPQGNGEFRLGDFQVQSGEIIRDARLVWKTHGTLAPEQLVDMWSREKRMLQPGLFPAVSNTGRWEDVAHYTQMIWKTTTHVGCAIYRDGTWDYLICRYSPPGNRDGRVVP